MASSARHMTFLCLASLVLLAAAHPDGSETHPVPGPGLSYGGIPYGSMSGNVAAFFKPQAAPSGRSANFAGYRASNYAPIEQWL